ncbi:MAG: hypothetical protein HY316_03195 [Acidobacteria bacterium]|nr:hypothetical protein [Acidobacteriota bacterium]
MPPIDFGFTARERSIFRRLSSPQKIQCYLDGELGYDTGTNGSRCRSPRSVLREGIAQCVDGALFGAAALRMIGYPPLLLDLEAVRDDDHVLAIFQVQGRARSHWGAIAKSNYAGLRFREPVYRTLRELVMSYFEHYYNPAGEKTLRRYSRPVNLSRFDFMHWMTTHEDVWAIPEYLSTISHTPLLPDGVVRKLGRMDDRLQAAGLVGHVR